MRSLNIQHNIKGFCVIFLLNICFKASEMILLQSQKQVFIVWR